LDVGTTGRQPPAERLGRYLRARQVLLVLDTFEHVLPAAPQLAQLLAAAPRLKLLVTSRVAIEISGEHRFTVLPLAVPPANYRAGLITAAEPPAPAFALTEANLPAVGEICRRLDGLPLAIELAAARAALFTPQELLAHLNDRFAFLISRARDLPSRHMTLAQAIDWSYNLLTPANQLLFRRLSVFVGGGTIAASQAVCNSDGALGNDTVDGIATLEASSLIQRAEGYDGRSRFGMLETVREYALNQLAASGEAEAVRRRHAAYYLALAEAAEQVLDRSAEWAWLRRLVSVRENLRVALRWALDAGDTTVALRLNAALFKFWTTCSTLMEARGWVDAALALARPAPTPELAAAEAKLHNVAGYIAAEMSDYALAYASFARGLAIYQALGDPRGIAWSIRGCALVDTHRDEFAAAERRYNQSLGLCRSSGDDWGAAWSLYALAFLKLAEGDLARARPALEQALLALRRQDMAFGVFRALLALGYTLFEQGDIAGAEARLREGLALSRETPLLTFITIGLDGLAMVATLQGRPVRAARLWAAAELLRETTDERRWATFQRAYDRALAAARTQVSAADWAAAWAAGRAMSGMQALDEALEDAGPAGGSR
jgi:non-specific serine/threonine protein kinase